MKISELMTSSVISVNEDMLISEVAEVVSKNKIHAVPVVDALGKVVGIITETDFFTKDSANMIYMPSLVDFMKSGKMNYSKEEEDSMKAIFHAKAKDVMTPNCESVSPDMKAEDFIKLIKEKKYNSYPVIDGEGLLVGMVTVTDAIKLL